MGIEFELKYGATPALLSRLRQDISGQEQAYAMHTTYYDTPTGQFSARRCTLRCRLENGSPICTLKTPAEGFGRREWEVACARVEDAIEMLCKLGAPKEILSLAREGLVPICGARFTRIAKTVALDGCVVELALDEGELYGADRKRPFWEVEVELKDGSSERCVAYAKTLAQTYGLVSEHKSKFQRALALYRGEE